MTTSPSIPTHPPWNVWLFARAFAPFHHSPLTGFFGINRPFIPQQSSRSFHGASSPPLLRSVAWPTPWVPDRFLFSFTSNKFWTFYFISSDFPGRGDRWPRCIASFFFIDHCFYLQLFCGTSLIAWFTERFNSSTLLLSPRDQAFRAGALGRALPPCAGHSPRRGPVTFTQPLSSPPPCGLPSIPFLDFPGRMQKRGLEFPLPIPDEIETPSSLTVVLP